MSTLRSPLRRDRVALLSSILSAALLSGLVIATLMGASGTAAADVSDTNRTVRTPAGGVTAGSTVTVVTSVTVDENTGRSSITERFSPPVAGTSIDTVTVNGTSVSPFFTVAENESLSVVLRDLDAGATVRIRYAVEIPNDASSGDRFAIDGTVVISNGPRAAIAGESRITVGGDRATATATATPNGNATASPTPSPSPTANATPSPSPTANATPSPSPTPTPESTPAQQPIATPSPTPEPTPAPGTETQASNPGFGIVVALLALLVVALVLRRR